MWSRAIEENWEKTRDRKGWLKCLEDHCAELKGHQVVRQKNADRLLDEVGCRLSEGK